MYILKKNGIFYPSHAAIRITVNATAAGFIYKKKNSHF